VWNGYELYNPGGRIRPDDYRFPFPDSSFDLVLLKSVFTHMMPVAVETYLREISRVLKTGGRSVITYFLLNDESRRFNNQGQGELKFTTTYQNDPLCCIANPAIPEFAVAHDENRMRNLYAQTSCSVVEMAFGNWCGRASLLGLQDLVVAIKE
jgi:ubiquinone/menaquinone biosynthesis C-methylase UbiE